MTLNNVEKKQVYYRWHLISKDPDDNKFVDCAIAGATDYIITNDKHFDELKKINFPAINVLTPDQFLNLILGS